MIEVLDFEPPRPYAACSVAGGFAFVAGETGTDPHSGAIVAGVAAQTEQALDNIRATLARVGCGLADIVRLTVYLKSIADIREVSGVRQRMFGRTVPSATVEVSAFFDPRVLIEIEATAAIPQS